MKNSYGEGMELLLELAKYETGKINRTLNFGCSNHSCRIKKPKGMGTDGPCFCRPDKISERLLWLAEQLDGKREWK